MRKLNLTELTGCRVILLISIIFLVAYGCTKEHEPSPLREYKSCEKNGKTYKHDQVVSRGIAPDGCNLKVCSCNDGNIECEWPNEMHCSSEEVILFEELESGIITNSNLKEDYVIADAQQWDKIRGEITSQAFTPVRPLDFTKELIIGTVDGSLPENQTIAIRNILLELEDNVLSIDLEIRAFPCGNPQKTRNSFQFVRFNRPEVYTRKSGGVNARRNIVGCESDNQSVKTKQ